MSVLLSALDKLRLHLVYDVLLLLTHRLTKGIALASGKVGKLSAKQHHLLLIHGNSIGILQILLHTVYIVFYRLASKFTVDEVGNIIHRARTIEGVHGNEVLER